jgi:hypothetical protein
MPRPPTIPEPFHLTTDAREDQRQVLKAVQAHMDHRNAASDASSSKHHGGMSSVEAKFFQKPSAAAQSAAERRAIIEQLLDAESSHGGFTFI